MGVAERVPEARRGRKGSKTTNEERRSLELKLEIRGAIRLAKYLPSDLTANTKLAAFMLLIRPAISCLILLIRRYVGWASGACRWPF